MSTASLPLTLSGSHSQYDLVFRSLLYQEEEQLVVQGPLFAPAIIQDRGQSQSHVDGGTSRAAIEGQGTSPKGPTLCTVPVQWTPIGYPLGSCHLRYMAGGSRQVGVAQRAPLRPCSQAARPEASPVSLT